MKPSRSSRTDLLLDARPGAEADRLADLVERRREGVTRDVPLQTQERDRSYKRKNALTLAATLYMSTMLDGSAAPEALFPTFYGDLALPAPGQSNTHFEPCKHRDGAFHLTDRGRAAFFANATAFSHLHPELIRLKAENDEVTLPGVVSHKGQALTLLAAHPGICFCREDVDAFFAKIGRKSSDPIQAINKAPQVGIGIVRHGARGRCYALPHPIRFDGRKIPLRVGNDLSKVSSDERDRKIKQIRESNSHWFDEDETWDWGHLDPDDPQSEVIPQPGSFNRPYRDRFKFDPDDGGRVCPTANHLAENLRKFYKSDAELKAIRDAIDRDLSPSV